MRSIITRRKRLVALFLFVLALPLLLPTYAMAVPGATPHINGDGVVNLADVGLFVSLFFLGTYQPRIDLNCDGVVNLADVSIFAAAL